MGKRKKHKGPNVPPYTGWRPRSMRRKGKGKTVAVGDANSRKAKRTRLGNAKQRYLYKSAKGHKHPDYSRLCRVADKLNGKR